MSNKELIMQLSERWADAERAEDSTKLEELVDGDFTLIGPRGFVLNREQWVNRYRGGNLKNESFDWKVESIREYDGTALVQGVQTQKTFYQGQDSSGNFRVTLVAVKNGEDWHLAHIQLSGPLMDMGNR